MMRPVLVVYDIFDNVRRQRMRDLLAPLADRIQQSGWLIPAHAQVAVGHLADGLAPAVTAADRLRLYAPCPHCVIGARWLPADQPHTLRARRTWIVE